MMNLATVRYLVLVVVAIINVICILISSDREVNLDVRVHYRYVSIIVSITGLVFLTV